MTQKSIIIVAGGQGLRVGASLPKQFIPIAGKPILMHTIEAFYCYDSSIEIVLVLPESHCEYWNKLCDEYKFTIKHKVAIGGETRFHSVKNGLELANGTFVGVHDGARPFASGEMIARCYDAAKELKAIIPVIDSVDSLREIFDDGNSKIVDRKKIKAIQTPQVFERKILQKAYLRMYKDTFTDDASVVEADGGQIYLIEGDIKNIKITTPLDLQIAPLLFSTDK